MADFDVGGEEVADGGAVRGAFAERKVVAHAVGYGGTCLCDGHACNCGGEHELFVQARIDGGVGKEGVFALAPEFESVFGAHAVECVRMDVQDAFDHVGEGIDCGVDDERFFRGGEVFAVDEGERGENPVRDAFL